MTAETVAQTTASRWKRQPSPSCASTLAASESAEAGASLEYAETTAFEDLRYDDEERRPHDRIHGGAAVIADARRHASKRTVRAKASGCRGRLPQRNDLSHVAGAQPE